MHVRGIRTHNVSGDNRWLNNWIDSCISNSHKIMTTMPPPPTQLPPPPPPTLTIRKTYRSYILTLHSFLASSWACFWLTDEPWSLSPFNNSNNSSENPPLVSPITSFSKSFLYAEKFDYFLNYKGSDCIPSFLIFVYNFLFVSIEMSWSSG